jgi:RNA polymerase sigma-70 factor (ECF subfamily)
MVHFEKESSALRQSQRVIGELFLSEKKRLTLLALRFTRNVVDAEDVVQAAFVRALEHTPQLISASNRGGWLSTTVQRLAINCIQRARTKTTLNVDPSWVMAPEPQPIEWWAELDFGGVLRALDRCGIDPILRETFDLWWFHGLAYKQIAARLQIPASTVGTRVYRVKQQLRGWARVERFSGNIPAEGGHSM